MPHFLCPPSLPRNRASGRPRNNVFITSHVFGPPAAPALPLPRRCRSFHAAGEGGLARAARPGRARGPGPGRDGVGRVRGLGPHERRLRGGLQPREGGPGFKGAPQLILVIRRGRSAAPLRSPGWLLWAGFPARARSLPVAGGSPRPAGGTAGRDQGAVGEGGARAPGGRALGRFPGKLGRGTPAGAGPLAPHQLPGGVSEAGARPAPRPPPPPPERARGAICQALGPFPYEGRAGRLGSAEWPLAVGRARTPRGPGWIWPHLHSRC